MAMTDAGPSPVLIEAITRNWRLMLMRGLAAIAFGVFCFAWPAISLLALVLLWGAYTLVDGIGAIVWGVRSRWLLMVVVGAVSVLTGAIVFVWPGITALVLLYLIAAWAIVRGAAEIAAAIRLRRQIENERLLIFAGTVSVVFGVLVAVFPGAGAVSILWMIGSFAIIFGALAVGLSLRLRSLQQTIRRPREEAPVSAGTSTRRWGDEDVR